MKFPSAKTAQPLTQLLWPSSTILKAPVSASHTRTVLSWEAETMKHPSAETAQHSTSLLWPSGTILKAPVSASHTRCAPSCLWRRIR